MRGWLIALGLSVAGAAWAEPPKTSIFPRLRPEVAASAQAIPHPLPRPTGLRAAPMPVAKTEAAVPRPMRRPAGLMQQAVVPVAQKPAKVIAPSLKGSVCGDPAIRGEVLAPIGSKTKGCGVAEPVKVTMISGIAFSQPATIDCPTAKALKAWIIKGMRPAFGNREVVRLHIFGSYMCRSRNNVKGAKISEHGRGKAVDVAGFVFADGKEWTVSKDYNKTIRRAQKAACGIFGTTLGPGSDGYHEDHLHFDTASYRGGPYCR